MSTEISGDAVFVQLKADAEVLVRQIKDSAFDDAVVHVLTKFLDLRRTTTDDVIAELERRFATLKEWPK